LFGKKFNGAVQGLCRDRKEGKRQAVRLSAIVVREEDKSGLDAQFFE
jgi:hypothetical protein